MKRKRLLIFLIVLMVLVVLTSFCGTAAFAGGNRHHRQQRHGNFWLGLGLGIILSPPIFYHYHYAPNYDPYYYRHHEPSRRIQAPGYWKWDSYCGRWIWMPGN